MEAWLILFEDNEMRPEVFTGPGAERAAKSRYKALDVAWNVTLFEAVAKKSANGVDPENAPASAEQDSAGQRNNQAGKEDQEPDSSVSGEGQ